MKKAVVIVTLLTSVMTVFYHIRSQNSVSDGEGRAVSTMPTLDPSPQLQFQKPSRGSIGNIDVWNLKPATQMPTLKDMFRPVYTLVKSGRQQSLQRSDRPGESWALKGIVMRGSQSRALLYNAGAKKMKNAGAGETVDEQLTVRHVGSGSVTLEAMDGNKPQRFELHLFKAEKDNYAIKKKNL